MANRGELHLLKDSVQVNTAKIVTGQLGVILSAEPNLVEIADTLGDRIYGVAMWDGIADEWVTVIKSGFVKVQSGAIVAFDIPLMVDAAGKFITATTGQFVVGHSLESPAGADEEFEIELYQSGYYLP